MFPSDALSSSLMNSLLFYVCILGLIIFIATILRIKVPFFKKYFIPASLIGGVIGIILGKYGLGVIPETMAGAWATFPGRLINFVFAPMLMGMVLVSPKHIYDNAGPMILFAYIGDFLQVAIPSLIVGIIFVPLLGINKLFGTIVEIGWTGGHGTAGGLADTFTELGWTVGGDLALTSATFGLFIGIIVGVMIINYGVRKGYSSVTKSIDSLDNKNNSDIIAIEDRKANSYGTINKDVVEPFMYHFALICIAVLLGWFITNILKQITGLSLPIFPFCVIGGLIVQFVLSKTGLSDTVDRNTFVRIQGISLEILIVAAIATLNVPIIIEYALPLAILMIIATAIMMGFFFYVGPRIFQTDWFEKSIVIFGSLTGVSAVGLMLLRTVDPEMKSEAATAFALGTPFYSPFIGGGMITTAIPLLIINYGPVVVGAVFLVLVFAIVLLAKLLGFWKAPQYKATI